MEKMGLNEIRSRFLKFYEERDHHVEASYSLVPQNDKSLLFIGAGMAPLKNYFMGLEVPPKPRMATCQKCLRTNDIENVGFTARHATFFEMLGNFSFGDYFKKETLRYGWDFILNELKLDPDKLWPSVYEDDDEAFALWRDEIGVPEHKITRLGKKDNFWEIGTGPCGPCSEIYYDRGEKFGCDDPNCRPGCDCERYLEFWNHVFTQFDRDENGEYHPLAKKNIDTGMGLERIACILQDVDSIFEVDTIRFILEEICRMSEKTYGEDVKQDISIRIITDHIRTVTFLVCDGVMPNNEGRGYVLRRLLRRAARHGKLLGIEGSFLKDLVDAVIKVSGEAYPDLIKRQDYIKKIVEIEEDRFQQTIDQGLNILVEYIGQLESTGGKVLSGEQAFKLYDTYGFPLDLTKEILEEKQMTVDEESFKEEMTAQRDRARSARGDGEDLGWEEDSFSTLSKDITSEFNGYWLHKTEAKVLAIADEHRLVKEAFEGSKVRIILDQTVMYPEGGGQVGDHGYLKADHFEMHVTDVKKGNNGTIIHIGQITKGSIKEGDVITSEVDKTRRFDTARNHSATHLLQKALRMVLGDHVEQAGSQVDDKRLRFDFTHFQALTPEELNKIEHIVNGKIYDPTDIEVVNTSIDEARQMGAMALFGEKYGSEVRVVKMGDFSLELCGGTHLNNTAEIGMFKILSETGVAAGVRRIEAITGRSVFERLNQYEAKVDAVAAALKVPVADIDVKVEQLFTDYKKLQKDFDELKKKMASGSIEDIIANAKQINGFNVISTRMDGIEIDVLKDLGDRIKDRVENAVVVLGSVIEDKIVFLVMAGQDAVAKGAHAGNIIKEVAKVAGGGGGGKPNMAQAGGKDIAKTDEALNEAFKVVEKIQYVFRGYVGILI